MSKITFNNVIYTYKKLKLTTQYCLLEKSTCSFGDQLTLKKIFDD